MTATATNELGALALIDDAKRASALAEVRTGRMYDLGHVLDEHVPVFPGRYFKQTLVTTAHHANVDGRVGENDVNPAEDPECPFRVPQILNIEHGVFVVENLDLAAVAADGIRRFALILTHPKLRGATGAWTSPIALT
jgi:kynurenine formamidase